MKYVVAAAMLGALVGSAEAQQGGQQLTPQQMIDAAKRAEDVEIERRYNAEMRRQRAQPTPESSKPDPWANARTVTPPRERR